MLAPRIRSSAPLTFCLASKEETLRIPASAVKVLARILEEMARGNAVALIPFMWNSQHRRQRTCCTSRGLA